ncbi:hypothetical protein D3C86_1300810 [compost metagenome]
MSKNNSDFLPIVFFVLAFEKIKENPEERKNGQDGSGQVSDNRIFFELVRIKPNQENIG